MEKRSDLKERLELISKYSNNSLVRSLSVPGKLYLYEAKRVFDIHYLNTNPAHALFLYTKFKTKYIVDKTLTIKERQLDVEKIVEIMKEKILLQKKYMNWKIQKNKLDLSCLKSFKITLL